MQVGDLVRHTPSGALGIAIAYVQPDPWAGGDAAVKVRWFPTNKKSVKRTRWDQLLAKPVWLPAGVVEALTSS